MMTDAIGSVRVFLTYVFETTYFKTAIELGYEVFLMPVKILDRFLQFKEFNT